MAKEIQKKKDSYEEKSSRQTSINNKKNFHIYCGTNRHNNHNFKFMMHRSKTSATRKQFNYYCAHGIFCACTFPMYRLN